MACLKLSDALGCGDSQVSDSQARMRHLVVLRARFCGLFSGLFSCAARAFLRFVYGIIDK
jgi:hypothetical protein